MKTSLKPPKTILMKPVRFIPVLFVCIFFFSCQKEFSDPNITSPVVFNIDAGKFIDSVGITNDVQKSAINVLVTQLKDSALWNKFLAIYPMIGGTPVSMSYNLIDPETQMMLTGSPLMVSQHSMQPEFSFQL